MKITSIIDNGATLTLQQDVNNNVVVLKQDCKLKLQDNLVFLFDKSTSNQVSINNEPQIYRLDFNIITNPITPNAIILESTINLYIQTGSGSGDATASNQVLQLQQIQDASISQNIYKDSLLQSVFKEGLTNNSWFKNLAPISKKFSFSMQRPANVIAYSIGDAINDVAPITILFVGAGQSNGIDFIANLVSISVTDSSNVAVKPIFNYFFFKTAPPVQTDNVPISVSDAFANTEFIGAVNGSTMSVVLSPSSNNSIQNLNINAGLPMVADAGGDVYVIIGLNNAYIPTNSELFNFTFKFK